MQLKLAEIILLVMWALAGGFTVFGTITQHPKFYIHSLFSIETRWGKCAVGVTLLAFVVMRVGQWASSTNPTIYWSL